MPYLTFWNSATKALLVQLIIFMPKLIRSEKILELFAMNADQEAGMQMYDSHHFLKNTTEWGL